MSAAPYRCLPSPPVDVSSPTRRPSHDALISRDPLLRFSRSLDDHLRAHSLITRALWMAEIDCRVVLLQCTLSTVQWQRVQGQLRSQSLCALTILWPSPMLLVVCQLLTLPRCTLPLSGSAWEVLNTTETVHLAIPRVQRLSSATHDAPHSPALLLSAEHPW